jgi:hypothetical protein
VRSQDLGDPKTISFDMVFTRKQSGLELAGVWDHLCFGPNLTTTALLQLIHKLIPKSLVRVFMASHRANPIG